MTSEDACRMAGGVECWTNNSKEIRPWITVGAVGGLAGSSENVFFRIEVDRLASDVAAVDDVGERGVPVEVTLPPVESRRSAHRAFHPDQPVSANFHLVAGKDLRTTASTRRSPTLRPVVWPRRVSLRPGRRTRPADALR